MSEGRASRTVHRTRRLLIVTAAFLVFVAAPRGQTDPGTTLPALIGGNEQLGRTLLVHVQRNSPGRNVVVAPLSVSFFLGTVAATSTDGITDGEVARAFGWRYPRRDLRIALRMLLASLDKPPAPVAAGQRRRLREFGASDAAWIQNVLLYRGKDTFSPRFVSAAREAFGLTFKSTGARLPTEAEIRRSRTAAGPLPPIAGPTDFLVSSGLHLQTRWAGNTFMKPPKKGTFRTSSGELKTVDMLTSEVDEYRYAKTERIEAVALPCDRAYLIAVLPEAGQDVGELARELAADPRALDSALKPSSGTVTMPPFHFQTESDLRRPLEEIGVKRVFEDLGGLVNIKNSRLTDLVQRIDITVDAGGIIANGETVIGGIYGGFSAAPREFSMTLDRPFVFLVRDVMTDALLFVGAVVDPSPR